MALNRLDQALRDQLRQLEEEGRSKPPERVINGFIPASGDRDRAIPLEGQDRPFLRMNSNSYLSLSRHPALIEAADRATRQFGVGPGAVRFIDGTFCLPHRPGRTDRPLRRQTRRQDLQLGLYRQLRPGPDPRHPEEPTGSATSSTTTASSGPCASPACRAATRGSTGTTTWTTCSGASTRSDPAMERVVVIFDGIFSMRGDYAPIDQIVEICSGYQDRFRDGVITVVDDSHGIGAYGATGRGTAEFCGGLAGHHHRHLRQGLRGQRRLHRRQRHGDRGDPPEGRHLHLHQPLERRRLRRRDRGPRHLRQPRRGWQSSTNCSSAPVSSGEGLAELGLESIPGPHPIVPLLVRDTAATRMLVNRLFDAGVLVVGLTFPVVPRGDETIRFQINAAHTEADIAFLLDLLGQGAD